MVAPFLTLAVLAAAHAPGFLWSEEGGGYDALEYHLQLPKEYRAAGEISYTPHNVYGSFPANVEMLYLLAMVVLDEDMEAGTTAHMIHLALAALTVFAAYVAGREWSPRAGAIAGVVAGSCGWLVFLSGLAYVENGLLLFSMTAVAAIVRTLRPSCGDPETPGATATDRSALRWFGLAGVCAGFACGCKYTGIPMVAVPVAALAKILLLTIRDFIFVSSPSSLSGKRRYKCSTTTKPKTASPRSSRRSFESIRFS